LEAKLEEQRPDRNNASRHAKKAHDLAVQIYGESDLMTLFIQNKLVTSYLADDKPLAAQVSLQDLKSRLDDTANERSAFYFVVTSNLVSLSYWMDTEQELESSLDELHKLLNISREISELNPIAFQNCVGVYLDICKHSELEPQVAVRWIEEANRIYIDYF